MCQSPMPIAEYRALQERIKAQQPKECPRCYSDSAFTPSFVDESYECACGWVWFPEGMR